MDAITSVFEARGGWRASTKGTRQQEARPSLQLAAGLTASAGSGGAEAARAWLPQLCATPAAPQTASSAQAYSYGLNRSQLAAVKAATTGTLTLVQGPPGTGKTKVAITILVVWVRSGAVGQARQRAHLHLHLHLHLRLVGRRGCRGPHGRSCRRSWRRPTQILRWTTCSRA